VLCGRLVLFYVESGVVGSSSYAVNIWIYENFPLGVQMLVLIALIYSQMLGLFIAVTKLEKPLFFKKNQQFIT